MRNKKILGILIVMLLMPATLKISAMSGNINNQNNVKFFNFPADKKISEFCFSENNEFNLEFEELLKKTIRDRVIEYDLIKYYEYIKENNTNNAAFRDYLIEKFKENNRKYFKNYLKNFKEKNLYLKLNYYERLINLIYEYSLKALIYNIENLGAENVSTKAKIDAISKYSDNIVGNIINCIVKRVIRDKLREKEENLNNVEELNEIMPFKDFETFEEYEKYANDVAQSQYNKFYNPTTSNLNLIHDTKDVWYESIQHIVSITIRAIFEKEKIN